MKIWRSIAAVVALLIAPVSPYPAQTPATIEGIVLDAATNEPIIGALVGFPKPAFANPLAPQAPLPGATTDSQGRFSFTTTETGRVRVVPTKDGYTYARPGQVRAPAEPGIWVQVSPGAHIKDLELRMARPAVITGRVLKADGQPLVGNAGSVSLNRYTYGTDGNRTLGWVFGLSDQGTNGAQQRTNDLGEYRFYNVPPGEYYLVVTGGGSAIGATNLYVYPGSYDESKAMPIRVVGGEEIRVETLTLPPRPGVEVKLHLSGSLLADGSREVFLGDSMIGTRNAFQPDELVIRSVVPGHYDLVVRNRRLAGGELMYGVATVDVGSSSVNQDVVLKPGAWVTGKVVLQNETGERTAAPSSIRCNIRSRYGLLPCANSQVIPGPYDIELNGLSPDTYVLSAKSGGRDVLSEGLNITGDTDLEIVLADPGGIAQGVVRDAAGNTILGAVVAAVPDEPRRTANPLYRSVVSDPDGRFEIHGIAPGSYKLFAWTELDGAAYRNAEFMKDFEERGKPVMIEKGTRVWIDLTTLER